MLHEPVHARKTGMTCCRVAVSADQAEKALGKLPDWWQEQRESKKGYMHLVEALDGTSRLMVAYPLRDVSWLNISWVFQTQNPRESTTESWHANGDRDEIIEVYQDFGEELKTLLR